LVRTKGEAGGAIQGFNASLGSLEDAGQLAVRSDSIDEDVQRLPCLAGARKGFLELDLLLISRVSVRGKLVDRGHGGGWRGRECDGSHSEKEKEERRGEEDEAGGAGAGLRADFEPLLERPTLAASFFPSFFCSLATAERRRRRGSWGKEAGKRRNREERKIAGRKRKKTGKKCFVLASEAGFVSKRREQEREREREEGNNVCCKGRTGRERRGRRKETEKLENEI
jgi:hypothetical protein